LVLNQNGCGSCSKSSLGSDLVELSEADLRVFLGKLCLMLRLIVKGASVLLCITMFSTEGEITLALEAEETNLLLAFPAERFVSLQSRLVFH
jgi:hypothetical protein